LQYAGHHGEVVVAKARLGLIGAISLIPVVALMQAPSRSENWVSLGVSLFALALGVVALVAARRNLWARWLGAATSLIDVTMVSLAQAIYVVQGTPTLAANSRTNFVLYALAIAATTLRFDIRICLVTGIVAMVQYAAIAAWAYAVWAPNPTPDTALYGTIEVGAQVGRLIVLAASTWLAVAVVRQSARLRFASTHDPLTKLLNRGYFEERFAEQVSRSRRSGAPLAIAILDVDHFKRVNDERGHPAGDSALRAVSSAIRHSVRRSDVVARYGGEEFVMMLEDVSLRDAIERVEKLRARVAATELNTDKGDRPLSVTLSGGIAVFPDDGNEPDELLSAADRRLLQAKRTGRNRVVHPELT
jgi:diguanylate cyclase (GGDEF)-like protein